MTVAALYVDTALGPYARMDGVECWGWATRNGTQQDLFAKTRDARDYRGPHPVVAHPPCERWGRYWSGGPSAKRRRLKGDDAGCFAAALWSVRQFGGVLEHPQASHAWPWFGLRKPEWSGGWAVADSFGGITCCVMQGHYGHESQKATWLYAVGIDPVDLVWGPAPGLRRLDEGFRTKAERDSARMAGATPRDRLSRNERVLTPVPFRDLLLSLARSSVGGMV